MFLLNPMGGGRGHAPINGLKNPCMVFLGCWHICLHVLPHIELKIIFLRVFLDVFVENLY